ncbi:recombinase family protein [Alysiella crassa]|uniref:DNA-invertase hin n=1 Tax=Alysiella crassa TaxID=153491 RepID=A0A376BL69_9NEIS|nr:recombinase family protein [Alysiella crassa]UOP07313.1 recombinase family protein [Alysiella crassa]SSY70512.1 DNA-invertase hin [Alysiella crassa]
MAKNITFGYARVSTTDQNLDSQKALLIKAGCEQILEESISGKDTDRPELIKLRQMVRDGDTVIVTSLDRLGRSLTDLVQIVNEFKDKGVIFKSLRESIDVSSAVGNMQFKMFAIFAEFERELIRERTKAGLMAARARGRKGGRKSVFTEKEAQKIRELYDKGITAKDIAKMHNVTPKTILGIFRQPENIFRHIFT